MVGLVFVFGLLLGVWVGAILGVVMAGLLASARRRDEEDERVRRRRLSRTSAERRRAMQRHPSVPRAGALKGN